MIDKATVQRIKDAADIVDVVGEYVHLVKRGQNYMGLCPFHNEKTPSFSVNRARNFCYCFSCHKGGSPVNFLMEKEGISYHDALLRLAARYGIKVEERELSAEELAQQSEREAMLTVNEWAARSMHTALTELPEGRDVGLSYLYGRGVTAAAVERFELGYCPDRGPWLTNKAIASGYDVRTLEAVGLTSPGQNGKPFDKFHGRVIFPVKNSAGKTVAFGARDLKGKSPAKYMNSPESAIYKKSRELYGLYQAKNAMSRLDKCYLVEGYLDVIGLWQSGIENVVASSGTALTDGQIALIHRFTPNVTLIYDGDNAGIKASLRGIDMLLANDMRVKVLLLPDGHDPDSFARAHTPEETRQYIDEHETDFIRYKAGALIKDAGDDPAARAEAVRSVVMSIASISDAISRATYIHECAMMFSLSETMLTREVAAARRKGTPRTNPAFSEQQLGTPATPQNTTAPARKNTSADDVILPREAELLRLAMAYAMVPFADTLGAEEDGVGTINVWQYIDEEMRADGLELRDPLHRKVFGIIGDMMADFTAAAEDMRRHLDAEYDAKLRAGYDDIAARGLSMLEIERAEEALRESLDEEYNTAADEFSRRFAADELLSHEDSDVRALATRLLRPPQELSKYHYKVSRVVHEAEMLDTIVPRAIVEWKDALTALRIRALRTEVADESTPDSRLLEIMEELRDLTSLRNRFSKVLGERILVPRNEL